MAFANQPKNPQIAIYNCGGAGMNLGNAFMPVIMGNEMLKDMTRVCFVDTGKGNHTAGQTEANTIIVGSGKGSGKIRRENYEAISESLGEITHKFPPGMFNIVVHSLGGGSGSIIANELVLELLEKGQAVVVVAVGSTDSRSDVDNAIRTIESYDNGARQMGKPVVMYYRENSATKSRGEVDKELINSLTLLCMLFSLKAEKIDEADLRNFLNFPAVTRFPPGLVGMEIFAGDIKLMEDETVYTVATLAKPDESTTISPPPEYQTAGFIPDSPQAPLNAMTFGGISLVHYCTLDGVIAPVYTQLKELMARFDSASGAHKPKTFISNGPTTARGVNV